MAKQAVYDYSKTAGSNTDIDGLDSTGTTGLVKSGDNYTRSVMSHLRGFADDLGGVNTVAGTGDAITITLAAAPSALVDGMRFTFNASAATTGAAATITVTPNGGVSFGSKKFLKWSGGSETALAAGDIPAANALTEVIYDAARDSAAGAFMLLGSSVAAATTSTAGIMRQATTAESAAGTVTNAAVVPTGLYFPTGHLFGLTLSNNGSDATNDIDIAAGTCRDSTDVQNIIFSALTKQLDADWAAGTNAGGRYKGAAITNTTYHVWAVAKALGANPDIYFDPSAVPATVLGHLQAETGGASYLYVRRIGSIVRTGGAIKAFTQIGDTFIWGTPVIDVDAQAPTTSAVTRTLTVPIGIVVLAQLSVGYNNTTTTGAIYVSALASADLAVQSPQTAALTLPADQGSGAAGAYWTWVNKAVLTNTSGQVRSRSGASGASDRNGITTLGWVDTRGRAA